MRPLPGLLLVVVILLGNCLGTRAGDQDEALTLLNAAIKAHGGPEALERAARVVRKDTGAIVINGKDVLLSEELVTDLPSRFRLTVFINGTKARVVRILNGDKGWE